MKNKRGSALISALFIMTLVAIAATAMSTRLQLDIYRTNVSITSDKLYLASQAVLFWAMDSLSTNNKRFNLLHDEEGQKAGKVEDFPAKLQHRYPQTIIHGELYDLQAFFNLNNVQDKKFQFIFYRLLGHVLKKTDADEPRLIVSSLIYWLSPYQLVRGHDDSLNYYLKQHPPYLPGFQPLQSVSEFRLVQGVTAEIYQTLQPYLTALPTVTQININTASNPILMSLGNGLNTSQLSELLEARGQAGFRDNKKLGLLLQKLNIPSEQVTIESEYYLSKATVTSTTQDMHVTTFAIIKRQKNPKGTISVSVLRQSLNTL